MSAALTPDQLLIRALLGLDGLPAEKGNEPDTWCVYLREGGVPCIYGYWHATAGESHHSRWSTPVVSVRKFESHYEVETRSGSSYILHLDRLQMHRGYALDPSYYDAQGFTTSTELLDAMVQ